MSANVGSKLDLDRQLFTGNHAQTRGMLMMKWLCVFGILFSGVVTMAGGYSAGGGGGASRMECPSRTGSLG